MGITANLPQPGQAPANYPIHDLHRFPSASGRRAECGNPSCSRSWRAFLKDRRRPVFDGRWGCSAACVQTMVQAAIRRESAEAGAEEQDSQHRHRMPLGLILLTQGSITLAQLQRALEAQRRAATGQIGQWLVEVCGLEQSCITRALGLQWGCPALTTDGFDPTAMALVVPKLLVEQLGIIPLRIAAGRILYLAFATRLDASAAFAIERMSGLKVQSGLVDEAEWETARQRISKCDSIDCTFEHSATMESLSARVSSTLNRMQPRASRLVRVHQFYWLRMWLESAAMRTREGGIPTTKEDVVDCLYTVGAEQ